MEKRRNILKSLLGLGGAAAVASAAGIDESKHTEPEAKYKAAGLQLFFAYRDTVINFNPNTGVGNHIGTVEGAFNGTSITNFQFIPTSQTTIKYDNRCLISDIDGNQILLRVVGTGQFITAPTDASNPLLGSLMSLGGPLVATMTVLSATGTFAFLVGRKFPCKMVASNAVLASAGVLGNVYGEVYSDSVGVLSAIIESQRQQ